MKILDPKLIIFLLLLLRTRNEIKLKKQKSHHDLNSPSSLMGSTFFFCEAFLAFLTTTSYDLAAIISGFFSGAFIFHCTIGLLLKTVHSQPCSGSRASKHSSRHSPAGSLNSSLAQSHHH
ncbi:hypothetical protein BpHYR1_013434 [Brachionus plicatilis]|uniref:Uncharacterized protein n=1 Tax=Brachionus plicatilis TaxID=10195 RepID=A0A3M7Q955_BRAPC|nr:hypothetical protein BpHYR1_013434 [Brachionus plicatilis]